MNFTGKNGKNGKITDMNKLMETRISLYRRVNDNIAARTITLGDFLHKLSPATEGRIKELRRLNNIDCKAAKKYKQENLPCATISALFEGKRASTAATAVNPIICIDIDDMPTIFNAEDVKKMVFELPYVFYTALSARGEGVFAMVYFDAKNDFADTFRALEKDFKDMGITIDRNCKDITRLRFVSWDPAPLEKDDCEMYTKTMKDEYRAPEHRVVEPVREFTKNDTYDLYHIVLYLINDCYYRADEYETWLTNGFMLASLGDYGYSLFKQLSMRSNGYDEREMEHKWAECCRTTKRTPDDAMKYYCGIAKKMINRPNWRAIIRESYEG